MTAGIPEAVARSNANATKKPPILIAANIGSATETICESEAWTLFAFSFGRLTDERLDEPALWGLIRRI
jgi:hypothetical protein